MCQSTSISTKAASLPVSSFLARSSSMGRWVDNVFVERLWRSVMYEEVYLKAHESFGDARELLGRSPSITANIGISCLTGRRRSVCITKTRPWRQYNPRMHSSCCPTYGAHLSGEWVYQTRI
jgi:hypothetical protein